MDNNQVYEPTTIEAVTAQKVMSFGRMIRIWRNLNQKTIKDLARECGLSATYMSDIERDKRDPPNDALLEKVAAAIGAPPDYLYFFAGRLPPDIREYRPRALAVVQAFEAMREAFNDEENA